MANRARPPALLSIAPDADRCCEEISSQTEELEEICEDCEVANLTAMDWAHRQASELIDFNEKAVFSAALRFHRIAKT